MKLIVSVFLALASIVAQASDTRVVMHCEYRNEKDDREGVADVTREGYVADSRFFLKETLKDGSVPFDGEVQVLVTNEYEDGIQLYLTSDVLWDLIYPGESDHSRYYANKFKGNEFLNWRGNCLKYERFSD